jgi:nucleotide-binding universal stress UspA family protein
MPLHDILVQLDATEQSGQRLRLAADLARKHGAHLTGLHVYDPMPALFVPDPSGGAVIAELLEQLRADAIATATRIEADFRERLRREGIAGEWRLVEGSVPQRTALHARYADLVILGQDDPATEEDADGVTIEATLFTSGRPVLLVPFAGRFETLGRRVLIGWNAGREASRAVHDALPVIAGAEHVTILAVNPDDGAHGEEPGADIARHLARHGLAVTVERTAGAEIGAGDLLLNRAAEIGADLIVTGAYGHSRFRELVLGGVTRTLLRQMTVPVLMSH